jgi:4-diphosphocytidyl-2-C-methyl-D-erythritol kinase
MRGTGELLSDPVDLPPLPAILVNPGVALATRDVFGALEIASGLRAATAPPNATTGAALLAFMEVCGNDLEAPAVKLQPLVAEALAAMRALDGVRLARMSGSGATCFALFDSARAAQRAARNLRGARPQWWVRALRLG